MDLTSEMWNETDHLYLGVSTRIANKTSEVVFWFVFLLIPLLLKTNYFPTF